MVAAKQRHDTPHVRYVHERVKLCRSCNGAGWVLDFELPVNPDALDDRIALALIPCPDDSCDVAGTPILTLDVHQGAFKRASNVEDVIASLMQS